MKWDRPSAPLSRIQRGIPPEIPVPREHPGLIRGHNSSRLALILSLAAKNRSQERRTCRPKKVNREVPVSLFPRPSIALFRIVVSPSSGARGLAPAGLRENRRRKISEEGDLHLRKKTFR